MRNQLKHFAVVAVLLAAACALSRNAFAQETTLTDKAQQSIVYIWFEVTDPTTGAKSLVQGTGFIVSKSGYVLTASHLFRDWGKQTDVERKQNIIKGSLRNKVGLVLESPLNLEVINPGNADYEDVALLKLPGAVQSFSVASVCLRETSAARSGDNIVGYGFPENEPFQPVQGTLGTTDAPRGRWAASAAFTYGMSGGPVYDKRGFVVGLIRGGLPGTPAVTWITPIQHAIGFLNQAGYVEDCPPPRDPTATTLSTILANGVPPVPAKPPNHLQLGFEVRAKRAGTNSFIKLDDGAELASNVDDYCIVIHPLTGAYLYVFQQDAAGRIQWLFPSNDSSKYSSGANPVLAGQILTIPAQTGLVLYLDSTIGTESIFAVFSATRWLELESALRAEAKNRIPPDPNMAQQRLLTGNRGIGGIRKAPVLTRDAAIAPVKELNGITYRLPAPVDLIQSSGNFVVIKHWFKHVAPP